MRKVKICGVRTPEAANFCVKEGADFLGINLSPVSKRKVSLEQAKNIISEILDANKKHIQNTKIVLLFFKNPLEEILFMCSKLNFHYIQILHSDPMLQGKWDLLRERYSLLPSFSVEKELKDNDIPFPTNEIPILDTPAKEEGGGTGKTFPWERLKQVKRKYLLAGGLNPINVEEAIKILNPWGVDVASGIEDETGNQSFEKMKEFIQKVKNS